MQIPTFRLNGVPDGVWVEMPNTGLRARLRVPVVDDVDALATMGREGASNAETLDYIAQHLVYELKGFEDSDGNEAVVGRSNMDGLKAVLGYMPVWKWINTEIARLMRTDSEGNAGNGSV